MAKNIESIIKTFNLTKIDIIKINVAMHKDHNYLGLLSKKGQLYSTTYTSLFEKHTIKYINSIRNKKNKKK